MSSQYHAMPSQTRGKFITLYGVNTIGKTTHAKRLVQNLRKIGKKAEYVKYPVYSLKPSGPFLNKILRFSQNKHEFSQSKHEFSQFKRPQNESSRVDKNRPQISERLSISEEELQLWFVLNRYQFEPKLKKMLDSGVTVVAEDYTGTGIAWGIAKGLERRWLECINEHLLKEDVALFLSGNPSLESREEMHLHEQNETLMNKAKEVFETLAQQYVWHRIKVCDTPDETEQLIWHHMKERIL